MKTFPRLTQSLSTDFLSTGIRFLKMGYKWGRLISTQFFTNGRGADHLLNFFMINNIFKNRNTNHFSMSANVFTETKKGFLNV